MGCWPFGQDSPRALDGDIHVNDNTIIVTYYNAPHAEFLRQHYEHLPEKLVREKISSQIHGITISNWTFDSNDRRWGSNQYAPPNVSAFKGGRAGPAQQAARARAPAPGEIEITMTTLQPGSARARATSVQTTAPSSFTTPCFDVRHRPLLLPRPRAGETLPPASACHLA